MYLEYLGIIQTKSHQNYDLSARRSFAGPASFSVSILSFLRLRVEVSRSLNGHANLCS
jgi:hypothetical protein